MSAAGREYSGTLSESQSGYLCSRWDAVSHNFTESERYPDASMSDAQNYCRNADGKLEGPWCFVDGPFVEWDFCDIPTCDGKDFLNLSAFQFLFSVGKIQLLMKIYREE